MPDFELITAATCDLPNSLCKELDLKVIPMEFTINGVSYLHYLDAREMSFEEFYTRIKEGQVAKTVLINCQTFIDYFEPILQAGKDILFLSFTSGLSGTYNACNIAMQELREKYPDRKIICVDSLCASIGEGFFDYLVALKRKEGLTIDELANYAERIKLNICHWFVVDDLDQLVRGGRINAVTATIGKAFQIKPLISCNMEGKLITVAKIRGPIKVFEALIERLKRDSSGLRTVAIGHSHNEADAIRLAEMLKEQNLIDNYIINDIGPIIGAHTGSGMLALVFLGERRFS
ncbi:MAG: DegV family protein [Bacillota bacterium]|nr:DegV family protein [Bacillota bacterium]